MASYLLISLSMQLNVHSKYGSNDLILPTLALKQLLSFVSHFRLKVLVFKEKQTILFQVFAKAFLSLV